MKYDHIITSSENMNQEHFHLSCGFYETTYFLFQNVNLRIDIHCKGEFTFCTAEGKKLKTIKAKPMNSGRGCYMDVLITTTKDMFIFQLPEYEWIDHYPNCDSESDRWGTRIIGIRDEIRYPYNSL